MVKDGRSDAEIRQYMNERYGDFISYKPPKRAHPPGFFMVFSACVVGVCDAGLVYSVTVIRQNVPLSSPIP